MPQQDDDITEKIFDRMRNLNTNAQHRSSQDVLDNFTSARDISIDLFNIHLLFCHNAELAYHRISSENDEKKALYLQWMLALWECRFFQWRMFWFRKPTVDCFMHHHRPNWPFLSGEDFEELTRAMLFLIEEKDYVVTTRTGDDGIDLECIEKWQTNIGEVTLRTAVQCKLWHGQVGSPIIREFVGARGLYTMGYFVTSRQITKPAQEWAQKQDDYHHYDGLYLIDTLILNELLKKADSIHQSYTELLDSDDDESERQEAIASLLTLQEQAKSILNQARVSSVPKETGKSQLSLPSLWNIN